MRVPLLFVWPAAALLFGLSFISPYLFWCFIPAFALLLYVIKKGRSYPEVFFCGWVIGSFQYAGSFLWVWTTYPINWIPDVHVLIQLSAIGFYWTLTSSVMGIAAGLFAVSLKRFSRFSNDLLVFAPSFWLASELLKSLIFSIYTFGDGGFVSFGFSFGYIGYLLADYGALLQMATVFGVYGLSFVCALIATLVYLFFAHKFYRKKAYLISACILLALPFLASFVYVRPYEKTSTEVFVVEAYFDKEFYAQGDVAGIKQGSIKTAVAEALQAGAQTIVMPEDVSIGHSFATREELFEWISQLAPDREVVIVDNAPATDSRGEQVIRTYIHDTRTETSYFLDKQYLVPQGEFMSAVHSYLLSLFVTPQEHENILGYTKARYGVIRNSAAIPEDLPGVLFCFETAVPYAVKEALQVRKSPFIAHSISHSWFTEPDSLESQLDQMLRVHAVWNNVPIVSAGTMVESHVYLPDGSIQKGETIKRGDYWSVKKFSL